MRRSAIPLLWLTLAACGNAKKFEDAGPQGEPVPLFDAPALTACTPQAGSTITMRQLGKVNGGATLATSPPNDGRLFVLEQDGRIRIFQDEQLVTEPFLDINSDADFDAGGEKGLLGLAFSPSYGINKNFFIYYTSGNANIVARYTQSADPSKADKNSKQIILSIPDFAGNHNGGMIEFGLDNYLYIGTGDGGGGGDPCRNGQAIDRNASTCQNPPQSCANSGGSVCEPLLGKILRIDVDHPANGKPYGIPATNPFAAGGGEPEIFILGMRNPWRWSFDRANGDLWIGDVGQNVDEELDVIPAGQQAGKNMGWSMYEATRCYGNYTCNTAGMTMPPVVKNQGSTGWHAIIGGQVYRGPCYPDLTGYYFYSDNTAAPLARAQLETNGTVTSTDLPGTWPSSPSAIHADARGELYMTTTGGNVYHLEAGP